MAKNKKTKVSRLTVRVPPKVHERLVKVASGLGLDVNGVVNFMFSRWLGQLELETKVYQELGGGDTDEQFRQMEEWMEENPGGTRKQYIFELLEEFMGQPPTGRRNRLPNMDGPVTILPNMASLEDELANICPPDDPDADEQDDNG